MEFNKHWRKLTKREKILLLITVPVVLIAVVQLLLINPLENTQKRIEIQMQKNTAEISKISEQIKATQAQLSLHSTIKLERQQKELKKQIKAQKLVLASLMEKLVPPQIMAEVVEKMLKKRGRLKLLNLANLEAVGLPESGGINSESIEKKQPIVYRHPLQLKFKGKFFDAVKYLHDLEKSGYGFYWDAVDYQVDKYPFAIITLQLSTLGTEEQWMGAGNSE